MMLGNSPGIGNAETCQRQRLIPEGQARVEKALATLVNVTDEMQKRLERVSRRPTPEPTSPAEMKGAPSDCPLADWLTELANQISLESRRIDDMLEHLEI